MCCLMITTVWNVVMLRSNLIHHGKVNKNNFYHNDCFEMPFLMWCMYMDEFVVYLFWLPCMIFLNCMIIFLPYPSLSPSSMYTLSLIKVSLYFSLSLFLSVKYISHSLSLSLSHSPLFSDCTQIWLAFHLSCEQLFTKTNIPRNKNK